MKRYEAGGHRVEIEGGLARVYKFIPQVAGGPRWEQIMDSPYRLPVPEGELISSSAIRLAVHEYELATGGLELRDALTRKS